MVSVKKNFLYNLLLTVGNYIFPLLTYPYVSRVLGVTKIGTCNYVDSIITYFVLFSSLGVSTLGIREIAKVKNNRQKVSEVFSSLVFINTMLSFIALVILIVLTIYLPSFIPYKPFLYVGMLKLLFSVFTIEWLFQGLSDFKYVTMRSLVIRTLYVINVFIFVRDTDDAVLYYLLTISTTVLSAIINWNYARKYISFNIKNVQVWGYIVPIVTYGLYRILTSMYTSFNVAYLGSVTDATQVGYFTTATKLYTIFMSFFTAFTAVMVPKVSEMLGNGESEGLKQIANKTFCLVFSLSFPLIAISYFFAPLIIDFIAGEGYEGAILPFQIVMILILVIALEQIIIQQFLMAVKDSKCVLVLSGLGAFIGVSVNILIVPTLQCIGSAISWTVSEICILFTALFYFKNHFHIDFPFGKMLRYMFLSIPYFVVGVLLVDDFYSWYNIIALFLIGAWFLVSNFIILPNSVYTDILAKIHRK